MKEAEITKLYNAKKEASFKAKLKMYLFFKAINGTKDISFESFNCSEVVEIYTTQYCQYLDDSSAMGFESMIHNAISCFKTISQICLGSTSDSPFLGPSMTSSKIILYIFRTNVLSQRGRN